MTIPNLLAAPTANTQATYGSSGSLDILSNLLNMDYQNPGTGLPSGSSASKGIDLAGLGAGLQGLAGLASAWAGLQGVKQGREQLRFTKDLTNRNLANQAQTTNTALADRQARRISASGGAYKSVADYMKENQVSGGAI
jgi:hypothetical protein